MKQFDPLVLDRTVIAIPLLRDIEDDLRDIQWVKDKFPDKIEKFNSAVEYNPSFQGGVQDAYEEVLEMLKEASEKAGRAADDQALQEAIRTQSIAPPEQDLPLSFADLHAAVIRRLLALNDRRAERPIARIHPTRFEVMIDLNLEYPGGRSKAREWVLGHIEEAKRLANVRDAGQRVHLQKENVSSQYVFARLEGRVIQALVDLDLAHAKEEAEKRRQTQTDPTVKAAIDEMRLRAIYHVWPDFEVSAFINKSAATVKADAVQKSFSAAGEGITWAVMDWKSGRWRSPAT